jgi:hypothetical protein
MSHSDDRRRRLLSEDSGAAEPTRTRTGPAAGPLGGYAEAARRQHQPHLIDLVPVRAWLHAALLAAGALVIAAVVSAYWFVPGAAEGRWPLLDVAQDASLATWLAAAWLGCAASLALVIYTMRRHRLDDYRGRYRMWLYAVPILLWLSLEQTAALGATLQAALHVWTGWSLLDAAAPYWTLALGGLLSLLVVRLSFETRSCRVATAGVLIAFSLACVGLGCGLGWLGLEAGRVSEAVQAALQLSAALLLLSSLGAYARYVILAADGRIAVRIKKVRARSPSATSADARDAAGKRRLAAVAKVDPPQTLRGPITARTDLGVATAHKPLSAARPVAASAAAPARSTASPAFASKPPADAEDDDGAPRKLTKAERKALKRQRMAADDQDDWWDRGD